MLCLPDAPLCERGLVMARVFFRTDRKGRKVWYVDYSFRDPETGAQFRKKERVGFSRAQAEESLQSRLTDIRRMKFDWILPEQSCLLEELLVVGPRVLDGDHETPPKEVVQPMTTRPG